MDLVDLPRRPRPVPPPAPARPVQTQLDELGTPLRDVTFVVVDLETTGGAPSDAGITEFGAVKVHAGEILGEFQTLVDPGVPVPPFVAVLTGITDTMLAGQPRLGAALPAFLEFARGSVLVAHNAPYDVGFLKAACALHGHAWPGFPVVDTARLARAVLSRDEVPNCKLGTLARFFRAGTEPVHRALADARATVDVLHGLLERVGGAGVQSLEELIAYSGRVSGAQRAKRHLADGLPDGPGVYLFEDGKGRALYVGTSRNLRSRVRQYFTAAEPRARMAEMVALAERVVPISCATSLEAQVRELRLIAERTPRYNRRSRFPDRMAWLKLTVEPFPRLSVVREVRPDTASGAAYLGPFGGSRGAELAAEALLEAVPLRTCRSRLPARPAASPCVQLDLGRCGAPCDGRQPRDDYAPLAELARACITHDPRPVREAVGARLEALVAAERFEDAAVWRDRLSAFLRGSARAARVGSLAAIAELVAARPTADHGWEVHVVRHGRLAAAATVPPRVDPRPAVDALLATAEVVAEVPPIPRPAGSVEEAECVLRWLEQPGVRLVRASAGWCSPIHGAAGVLAELELPDARQRRAVTGSAAERALAARPRHRPVGMGAGPLGTGPLDAGDPRGPSRSTPRSRIALSP